MHYLRQLVLLQILLKVSTGLLLYLLLSDEMSDNPMKRY